MTLDRPRTGRRSAALCWTAHLVMDVDCARLFQPRRRRLRGIYRGLNVGLGSDDDPAHVMENRARVSGWFAQPADRLVTVHQVHSPDVHVVTPDNAW
jgi:copper oxidase (laccase) domain-containing protein